MYVGEKRRHWPPESRIKTIQGEGACKRGDGPEKKSENKELEISNGVNKSLPNKKPRDGNGGAQHCPVFAWQAVRKKTRLEKEEDGRAREQRIQKFKEEQKMSIRA